jgi:hypothetical protein
MPTMLEGAERAFLAGRHARARDLCDLGLGELGASGGAEERRALERCRARAALAIARARTGHWQPLPPLLRSAMVLFEEGESAAALPLLDRAIALHPDLAEAHTYRGLALLSLGEYREGFAAYAWRERIPGWKAAPSPARRWDGRPLDGTLLLWDEQGLGDTIQFARFARAAARVSGSRVILSVHPRLVRLLRTCSGLDGVVSRAALVPAADAQLPLMSLPAALGVNEEDLAGGTPYLAAEERLVASWRDRLESIGPAPRVGLVWHSNSAYAEERRRAVPLQALAPLLERHPSWTFVCLQKSADGQPPRIASKPVAVTDLGADVDRGRDGFVDTAAVLMSLDLLITADTSIAHLAGALGRPVAVLLARPCDWRWGVAGDRTPFYSTARLFRQRTAGDWASAVDQLCCALDRGAM